MVKLENTNLRMIKGDTCLLRVELIDENNEVVDATECTAKLTVKEYLNDSNAKQKISLSIYNFEDSDPANGIIFFKFQPTDTQNLNLKKYYWDIQITRNGDIYTVMRGDLYIESEVTLNA